MILTFVIITVFVGLIGFLAGKAAFWKRDPLALILATAGLAALLAAFPPDNISDELFQIIGFGMALWIIAYLAYRNGANE
ncbi:MAG TPA: hypothetical protein DC031_02460 [Sulfitobacter sp.]|jgi:hypothetical protein|nr:hypothetical protein [Sulfitobacter sp.]HBB82146.1 hypothetical protein [Sulfitobacter sp.]|tara:strand:+ start:507 stop:746 length:240 start_codon:yes stop_codon:yes gene_type:complete